MFKSKDPHKKIKKDVQGFLQKKPTEMAALSPNAIAIKQGPNVEIYYSSRKYTEEKDFLDGDKITPEPLLKKGLTLIPEYKIPLAKDFEGALESAKQFLHPLSKQSEWYDKPKSIK